MADLTIGMHQEQRHQEPVLMDVNYLHGRPTYCTFFSQVRWQSSGIRLARDA